MCTLCDVRFHVVRTFKAEMLHRDPNPISFREHARMSFDAWDINDRSCHFTQRTK
jgi:hypothetical protein